jgi:vitamin B12/bleomycin/antimicrobial peptide transport system ATP-binding/permease protein
MLHIPINEQGWGLFLQLIRNFIGSQSGPRAVGLFVLLIVLLFGINGLNIVNSFVGRDFMTAIADRNMPAYLIQALIYFGVFVASTIVAVFLRYAEERLGLLWREWMTRNFLSLYLKYPTFYRMNDSVIKNSGIEFPDQRITDDVKLFTTTTLSFTLMLLNGSFTVIAFSGVLWSISPMLFGVAVVYAAIGSYLAIILGRPLIDLNYVQLDKEANFRSSLMHVRQRAESVALLHREKPILERLEGQFDGVVSNFQRIIAVNRNLGFFTTGYNYMVQIIPALLVAPFFIRGDADFGVITQATMGFTMLVGAFSLIITQFQSISSFAAVIERLINLWYAIELAQTETVSGVDIVENDERVAFENLTLRSNIDGHVLIKSLTMSVPRGTRVLITGQDEAANDALLKATAGIVDVGSGRVIRPRIGQILFLPVRPYLPPGTLRNALTTDAPDQGVNEEKVLSVLHDLDLGEVLARSGGLDTEHDWDNILSVREQQLISFARILLASPRFALLDHPTTDLDPEKTNLMLKLLSEHQITYLTVDRNGHTANGRVSADYDAILKLEPEGRWEWVALPKAG